MEFSPYLVIARDDKYSGRSGNYSYSVEGSVIYPLGQTIPLIQSGVGCVGIAIVDEFTVRATTTTVKFRILEQGEPRKYQQIYSMYQNSATSVKDSDDAFIPGLHRRSSTSTEKFSYPDDDKEDSYGFTLDDIRRIRDKYR